MKCIYCGKKAEYIAGGQSVCFGHIENPYPGIHCYKEFDKYVESRRKSKLRSKAE